MSFVDLCRKFISIDTSPQSGTKEGALWLNEISLDFGLSSEIQEEYFYNQDQANIFVRTAPPQQEEFLLQSHFDTPNPGSHSLWTENRMNPFDATIKEGRLYGLGACDSKIDLLCKLEALKTFNKVKNWKMSPVVLGTFGEQLGMQGLLRAIRKEKFSAKYAIVGEPSDHKLIYAGKGYAVLDFHIPFSEEEKIYRQEHNLKESASTQSKIFKGKATHSSEAPETDSAINKALEYLLQIPQGVVLMDIEGGTNHNTVASNVVLEIELHGGVSDPIVKKLSKIYLLLQQIGSDFLISNDSDFSPSHPTMNLGLIKSYEDHVHLTVAFRFPPVIKEEDSREWLNRVQKGATMVGGQCQVSDYKRPYRTDLNSDFVKTCLNALSSIESPEECITSPICTEMSLLQRKGIVCLGFGAGTRKSSSSISTGFVTLKDLDKSIQFYQTLIERMCL